MSVLKEICEWSEDRPAWQRDALRRLVLKGDLAEDDISVLTEICKAAHGLADQQQTVPLTDQHVPDKRYASFPVSIESVFHHRGVNALADDQTLKFGPQLTVVYGDNAAGKTGYIRILKSACRARGQEDILGDVTSGTTPHKPVVEIKYKAGEEPEPRQWVGATGDQFLSRVSVFDTHCAAVYLTEKTNVAFRPFGLDLFDKLVRACKAVRAQLDRERLNLSSSTLAPVQSQIPESTAAAKLIANVTSLTNPETVQKLALLSEQEESDFVLLEQSLLDMRANDPDKIIRQLSLVASRVQTLSQHIKELEGAFAEQAVNELFAAREAWKDKLEEAERLREAMLRPDLLPGTGSDRWGVLWESARAFSENLAYPEATFPVVENGAQCVLCQQDLDAATRRRLRQFETFVTSTVEKELRQAKEIFETRRKILADLRVRNVAIDETLQELQIEHREIADAISTALTTAEAIQEFLVRAVGEDQDLSQKCPVLISVEPQVNELSRRIAVRIKTLRERGSVETMNRLTAELRELNARKILGRHKQTVLGEIERKKKFAAYGLCINDTKTQAITLMSTDVTKRVVTQKLTESFEDELRKLDFRHVEVELKSAGGREGNLYHKLVLKRAPGVELPKVVSEGEQRCLSIAAFFAELSTAEEPSGIVFDDPVSSLDYKWREGVASRLVEEAKKRQVIVFTHDVVFLLLLKQFAEERSIAQHDQHVRQLSTGAGVCAEELPWVALKVAKRIGHLRKQFQDAAKLHREDHQDAYEREASSVYGYLREAWERGLEEVLLCGVVERYRPGVQTKQVTTIADITLDDCKAVEAAMTKCSKWLPGHDQAAAARADIPDPAALRADIEALAGWVARIRKRRQSPPARELD